MNRQLDEQRLHFDRKLVEKEQHLRARIAAAQQAVEDAGSASRRTLRLLADTQEQKKKLLTEVAQLQLEEAQASEDATYWKARKDELDALKVKREEEAKQRLSGLLATHREKLAKLLELRTQASDLSFHLSTARRLQGQQGIDGSAMLIGEAEPTTRNAGGRRGRRGRRR
eukprot:GHVU01150418.1.p1 GENE.GHVU01150418.1~~GHVU01150418.1.p1  ORF type:complete len:170 (+),score=41.36 GHVU01150418.1:244-753(+)